MWLDSAVAMALRHAFLRLVGFLLFFSSSLIVFFSQILIIYRFLSVSTRSRCHTYNSKQQVDKSRHEEKTNSKSTRISHSSLLSSVYAEDLSSFSNYQNAKLDLRSSPKISFSFQASSSIIIRLMTSFHLWKTVENVFSAVERKINETKGKSLYWRRFFGGCRQSFFPFVLCCSLQLKLLFCVWRAMWLRIRAERMCFNGFCLTQKSDEDKAICRSPRTTDNTSIHDELRAPIIVDGILILQISISIFGEMLFSFRRFSLWADWRMKRVFFCQMHTEIAVAGRREVMSCSQKLVEISPNPLPANCTSWERL